MRNNPLRYLIATMVVVFGLLLLTFPLGKSPKLGLDLQGGISVNLQPVKDGKVVDDVGDEQLDQAIEIIRRRVDALGVSEPEVSRQGNTITVQLPGAKDQQEVLDVVGSTAKLEFRPVLQVVGQLPTGKDKRDAEKEVEKLRTSLDMPEGVTAAQVIEDEEAKQPATETITGDGTVPAGDAPEGASPDGDAPGGADAPTPTDAPAPAGDEESGLGAPGGSAHGGNRSAMTAAARSQDDTSTTVADDAPPVDEGDGATTTTVAPPTPLNQWGVDVYDEDFATLYQTEAALDTELTPIEDQTPDAEVTLAGEDGTVYRLGPVAVGGEAVKGAEAGLTNNGTWSVNPTFKAGADNIDKFNEIAAKCYADDPEVCPRTVGEHGQLGIVLDGEVLSAPSINVPSFKADEIQITGSFDQDSAEALAVALRYGSLPIELAPQQAENVSATLGQGALEAGIISGLIGVLLAAIYLGLYYRLLAAVALGGLIVSGASLWTVMSFVGATVTLAGVVGIVVSIGTTVDSAVVYFESMKESVRNGVSVRAASDRCFSEAWSTIVKANVSSLIGAGVLYWLAVGPVRGFAFYLGAMTLLDLIALYVFVFPATLVVARSSQGGHPGRLGFPFRAATDAVKGAARSASAPVSSADPAGTDPVAATSDEGASK